MRMALGALAAIVVLAGVAQPGDADDERRFRRTTPRGSFGREGPALLVGVPGGRAWGIESALIPIEPGPRALVATVEVHDPQVREAFVRVAWYDKISKRPKQFALTDGRLVAHGERAMLEIPLDPPLGAVAYRLRVLARLRTPTAFSDADAVRAWLGDPFGVVPHAPLTTLLP